MNSDGSNGGQEDIKPCESASLRDVQKKKNGSGSAETETDEAGQYKGDTENGEARDDSDTKDNGEPEDDDSNIKAAFKSWLEVLPSKGGMLLAVLLAEIMTGGLTPAQMGLLGAFVASVGDLISYKAARDGLDC